MPHLKPSAALFAATAILVAACSGGGGATTKPATAAPGTAAPASQPAASLAMTTVNLQLQWAPQAQFAGYFAADRQGYYAAQGLKVNFIPGGPNVVPQTVGSDPAGPEFTISWVPKVLEVRAKGQSDLVDVAQIFQRAGTRSVSWAAGKGPTPTSTANITDPSMFQGKKVGVWDFGNEYEVTAGALKAGLTQGTDYTKVIQPFDMTLLLNRDVDVAEAMIYNEYAQVLEAKNPQTNALYQPSDLNVIDYNTVGTAMLQDAIFVRDAWLKQPGNEDVTTRFLRASFQGWMYCRDNAASCVQYTTDAGSTLGAGHQAWMMNEINPLVWPSAGGIGAMPLDTWNQTVQISIDAKIIPGQPDAGAYRTDLADAARQGITGDVNGTGFTKGTVTVTEGGK
jgi:NitT/TauT family transport system substrate-binding protein